MIKAVIFDMDGLIVDTEIIESKSLTKLLSEYGKTPILEKSGLVHIVGKVENAYEELLEKYSIEEKAEVFRNRKREIFAKLLEEKLTPYDGFFELIESLSKHKYKIALASNRYINHIFLVLKISILKNTLMLSSAPVKKENTNLILIFIFMQQKSLY